MRTRTRRATLSALLAGTALMLTGCGTFRETLPLRSAAEMIMLSTAADRAVDNLPMSWAAGRVVYVDGQHLDCYDKPYVLARVGHSVLRAGGRLTGDPEEATAILVVASGGLSVDKGAFLLGIPEIPVPVPFAAEPVKLPELPLFKVSTYMGKCKLLCSAIDAKTKAQIVELPTCYGRCYMRFWRVLLLGPFKSSNVPEPPPTPEDDDRQRPAAPPPIIGEDSE